MKLYINGERLCRINWMVEDIMPSATIGSSSFRPLSAAVVTMHSIRAQSMHSEIFWPFEEGSLKLAHRTWQGSELSPHGSTYKRIALGNGNILQTLRRQKPSQQPNGMETSFQMHSLRASDSCGRCETASRTHHQKRLFPRTQMVHKECVDLWMPFVPTVQQEHDGTVRVSIWRLSQ